MRGKGELIPRGCDTQTPCASHSSNERTNVLLANKQRKDEIQIEMCVLYSVKIYYLKMFLFFFVKKCNKRLISNKMPRSKKKIIKKKKQCLRRKHKTKKERERKKKRQINYCGCRWIRTSSTISKIYQKFIFCSIEFIKRSFLQIFLLS